MQRGMLKCMRCLSRRQALPHVHAAANSATRLETLDAHMQSRCIRLCPLKNRLENPKDPRFSGGRACSWMEIMDCSATTHMLIRMACVCMRSPRQPVRAQRAAQAVYDHEGDACAQAG